MSDKGARFLTLHKSDRPLLMPNPWDAGSARVLVELGFQALATTSSGFAATLGRLDGGVTREEALEHGAAIAAAVDVPVSADLENCFADDPESVAATVARAATSGLAGCSVEDCKELPERGLYEKSLAVERVAAAAEAAHRGSNTFVLTARAENHIRGNPDLDDTISRVQAYADAGADCVFAPGVIKLDEVKLLVSSVSVPVNVLVMPGAPTIDELAEAGVGRVSVGGAFAYTALAGLIEAGRELLDNGTYGYWDRVPVTREVIQTAFS
jgi:2-methylisocitrate lyase-like PEP mutase family enzyme